MTDQQSSIVMEEVTDPQLIAEAHARRERFDRNWRWLRTHAQEVYDRYRGSCISVAGEELFVGDTPQDVIAQAAAAHPDDDGSFVHYIPLKKMTRVINQISLAEQRVVVSKDTDFFYSHLLQGRPWKLVLVRTGNISTRDLCLLVERNLPAIEAALESHALVEIDRLTVTPVV